MHYELVFLKIFIENHSFKKNGFLFYTIQQLCFIFVLSIKSIQNGKDPCYQRV